MSDFLSDSWMQSYRNELNGDERWQAAAKFFSGRLGFKSPERFGTIDVRDGAVVSALASAHPLGADIVVSGSDAEWSRIERGETDWFEATSPGIGGLSIEGNAVEALRNVKVMWLSLAAMSRVGRTAPRASKPAFSPDPKPSGRPTTGHYIDVDGIRTYYEEAGDGPAIVCFHAACQDTLMYRNVLDGLSDEFRVISVDAPAHGKTLEPTDGPFQSLTRHAEFNERFIQALGLDRPVIVGCSMAGNLVLELGSRKPDGYAAIISCEGADYTPTVAQFFLDMLLVNGQQLVECWSQSLTGTRTPPARAREVVWQISRVPAEVMKGDLTGYAGFDKRGEMGKIRTATLLLRGGEDWLVSQKQVEESAARISGSEIAVLPGTGHYPMIENPLEFNDAVRTFLNSNGLGKRAKDDLVASN